jgi:adenylyltransferase/sulfurtransferase
MTVSAQVQRTHFVVVGAGGLGCPALLGLTAAGAQRITIVDPDVVETSNLQRQVLYSVAQVGRPKAEAAAWALRQRIRGLEVDAIVRALEPEDASAFVADLPPETIVLECTDMPALKFALNDAGLEHGTPVVIGAALGLRGQCIAVRTGTACYRCIYESPPEDLPTCESAGVLGVAVGLAGFVMASAAISLCDPAHASETTGALLAFDVRMGSMQTLRPEPRRSCPACAAAKPTRFPPFQASA